MRIQIVTLFPDYFEALKLSLVGKAFDKGLAQVSIYNPREQAEDVHKTVDDAPFGGGDGMLMTAPILAKTLDRIKSEKGPSHVVYLSPQGQLWTDEKAKSWAQCEKKKIDSITLICGRYAGIDQRFINLYVDEQISVGDFILTGGELAALCLLDSVIRLLPGVLGNSVSSQEETFSNHLFEAPQFTRPEEFRGQKVPSVLLSGHHSHIEAYKRQVSLVITHLQRPDLFKLSQVEEGQIEKAYDFVASLCQEELISLGFKADQIQNLKNNAKRNN